MPRFFKTGNDDFYSESESEDSGDEKEKEEKDEEEEEEEEDIPQKKAAKEAPKPKAAPALYYDSSEEEEPQQKRVVKSTKDKRFDEMNNTITALKNHMKINDWNAITNDFDKLMKLYQKASQIIQKEGIPRFFIQILVTIEDFMNKTLKDHKEGKGKKMSPTNYKSLNNMKTKLKKNNKQFEKEIEGYRKNPDAQEGDVDNDEEEEEEDDILVTGDENEVEVKPVAKKAAPAGKKKALESDDEDKKPAVASKPKPAGYWLKGGADDESSSDDDEGLDDDDDDDDDDFYQTSSEAKGKDKWLRKGKESAFEIVGDDKKKAKTERQKEKQKKQEKKKKKGDESGDDEQKKEKKEEEKEMTPEQIEKKIKETIKDRGKRGTKTTDLIDQLFKLNEKAKIPLQKISILVHLTSAHFDLNLSTATHMPSDLWKKVWHNLMRLQEAINENFDVVSKKQEEEEEGSVMTAETVDVNIAGSLIGFFERLDDELTKSLQFIDPHTQEYVSRLADENFLLEAADGAFKIFQKLGLMRFCSRIASRIVDHVYYKIDFEAKKAAVKDDEADSKPEEKKKEELEAKIEKKDEESKPVATVAVEERSLFAFTEPYAQIINNLAILIYRHGDERLKTRTVLAQIYHKALHDLFYEARDMMLMTHLQENIQNMDIPTQILFNRTMVQLGLCAFRRNLITEAHGCLSEIYAGGRVKELLAQGVSNQRFGDKKNPEYEKQERRRQVPFHMHINLEMLEFVHLTCAMLLEVPNMAANPYDPKRKVLSRPFRRQLDYSERQVFTGPPENTRDYVIAASKALAKGDWKECSDILLNKIPIWNLVPDGARVRAMLKARIQEEGLRTYLFTYSPYFASLSLTELSEMFELLPATIHSIVSKMMINEELHASWDQPTSSVVMHKVEPTRLQYLALQFAEKAAIFVENNERLLDSRTGGYGYKYDQQQKGRQQDKRDGTGRQPGQYPYRRQQQGQNPYGNRSTGDNTGYRVSNRDGNTGYGAYTQYSGNQRQGYGGERRQRGGASGYYNRNANNQ